MIISRIICLIIGYIFGLFQTGYLYGKTRNVDIRQHGSGNAGTTNTLRVLGVKAGVITFIGDFLKAVLAVFFAWLLFRERFPGEIKVLQMYAGLGTALGHNYPFYLNFKGGKGIASTAGFIFACVPLLGPVCVLLFAGAVVFTKYVSLGSILAAVGFLVQIFLFGQLGWLKVPAEFLPEVYALGVIFGGMALWRHRANMKRLLNGTENKLGAKKES